MRCQKKKHDGKQCRARALTGNQFCSLHAEPGKAAELGSRGGRGRAVSNDPEHDTSPSVELPKTAEGVRDLLAEAITQIRRRKLDTKVGNALAYVASSLLRAIELGDLESRLRALEERNGGGNGD
jgi:hypothetical protein